MRTRIIHTYESPIETRIRREAMLRPRDPSAFPVALSSSELANFRLRMLELEASALTDWEIRVYCRMSDEHPFESLAYHALVNYETGEYFDPYFK